MWIGEEANQNEENLGNLAEELQKLLEKVALLLKEKKTGTFVISFGLSVSNDSVLNDSLKFIFIFTF